MDCWVQQPTTPQSTVAPGSAIGSDEQVVWTPAAMSGVQSVVLAVSS